MLAPIKRSPSSGALRLFLYKRDGLSVVESPTHFIHHHSSTHSIHHHSSMANVFKSNVLRDPPDVYKAEWLSNFISNRYTKAPMTFVEWKTSLSAFHRVVIKLADELDKLQVVCSECHGYGKTEPLYKLCKQYTVHFDNVDGFVTKQVMGFRTSASDTTLQEHVQSHRFSLGSQVLKEYYTEVAKFAKHWTHDKRHNPDGASHTFMNIDYILAAYNVGPGSDDHHVRADTLDRTLVHRTSTHFTTTRSG